MYAKNTFIEEKDTLSKDIKNVVNLLKFAQV